MSVLDDETSWFSSMTNYEVKERFHHHVKDNRRIVTNGNAHDEIISRGRERCKKG
jgi:hypothetical protein